MKHVGFVLVMALFIACGGNDNNPGTAGPLQPAPTGTYDEGKKLFYARCASCHMVNKELTGPALRGVEARWPDRKKLFAFIRNSEAVIKEDKYARELWLKFNQTMMNQHPDLTDGQIEQILGYIKSVSEPAHP